MKIALIGYGKMGKAIEKVAIERGHEISSRISSSNTHDLAKVTSENTSVAIEFTTPETAFENCQKLIDNKIRTISGTTGWLENIPMIIQQVEKSQGAFLQASNFSIGVNIFYRVNQYLSSLLNKFEDYIPHITEVHHIQKLDKPSGTAIDLANKIIAQNDRLHSWKLDHGSSGELPIRSIREGDVPGTHIVDYTSDEDIISLKHEAFSREGFALGAVMVAEWISDKTGYQTMDDFIDF